MKRRSALTLLALVLLASQPSCFLKFWGKDDKEKTKKEKIYDVYGTVTEINREKLTITSKKGPMEFAMLDSSIKGGDFGPSATVHVFYRQRDSRLEVTMVVEKVK